MRQNLDPTYDRDAILAAGARLLPHSIAAAKRATDKAFCKPTSGELLGQSANLVYLSYPPINPCYTILTDQAPKGVEVDVSKGTWSFEGRKYKINEESRICDPGSRHGPIGVYDKSSVKNLEWMLRDSQAALREHGSIMDE